MDTEILGMKTQQRQCVESDEYDRTVQEKKKPTAQRGFAISGT